MQLALIVDNPSRDLPAMSLLAYALCQHDFTCYLVPMNLAYEEITSLAPDFVLLQYLRRNNQDFVKRLLQADVQVAVLDSEGGVMPDLEHYEATIPIDAPLRSGISAFYTWGPKVANHLRDKGWYEKEQLVVTGMPRYDFYSPPWREVSKKRLNYANKYPQPLVLITGNFAICNPGMVTPEEEVDIWVKGGHDRAQVEKFQALNRETMLGMVEIVNELARHFPDCTFIYRPHPFERRQTYDDLLLDLPNLHLDTTGTVDGWLMRSTAVIQRSSSTGIEAALIGVPSIVPAWLPVAFNIQTIDDVSTLCFSMEDLISHVECAINGEKAISDEVTAKVSQVIHDWFHAIDGQAHNRIAEHIASIMKHNDKKVLLSEFRRSHYVRPAYGQMSLAKLGASFRMIFDMPVYQPLVPWHHAPTADNWQTSMKYFSTEDVQNILDLIDEYSEEGTRVKAISAPKIDYHFGYELGHSVRLDCN